MQTSTLPRSFRLGLSTAGGLAVSLYLASCAPLESDFVGKSEGASDDAIAVSQSEESRTALRFIGDSVTGTLQKGQRAGVKLRLREDEAVWLEVSQEEVDIEIEVLDPGGDSWLKFDSPTGRQAPERLCFIARMQGTHEIVISPFAGAGRFRAELVRRSSANKKDRDCFEGVRAFNEAQSGSPDLRIKAYESAAELWQRADEFSLAALAWREAGSILQEVGPADAAIDRLQKARRLARLAGNEYLEVSTLNREGVAHLSQGDFTKARQRLDEALDRANRTNDQWGMASALTNLGLMYELEGYTHRGVDHYSLALELWQQIGNSSEISQVLHNLASAYGLLEHHQEALDILQEALELATQANDERREADVLVAEGWIHYLRGSPEVGVTSLQRALEIQRRLDDRDGEAAILDRLGTLLMRSGRLKEAEARYQASLQISQTTESRFDTAATLANLGCLYQEMGRIGKARLYLNRASDAYRSFNDPKAVSHIEYCLATTARTAGDLDSALLHIDRALGHVNNLRNIARTEGHYYHPVWLWQDYADLKVHLFLERYGQHEEFSDLKGAFEASHFARARTLFEQVIETRLGVRARVDEALLEREADIQAKINAVARSRELATTARSVADLESHLRQLGIELEEARAKIRASDPHHVQSAPRRVEFETAAGLIPPNTALLTYILGDASSHLLVLAEGELSLYDLEPRGLLEPHAESLYSALRLSASNPFQWHLAARTLSERLLPRNAIPASVRHVIVVPDGMLHYVPFAALNSPRNPERLLLEDLRVTYVPSVSVLASLRERRQSRRQGRKTAAVFADPVFSHDDQRLQLESGEHRRQLSDDSIPTTRGTIIERLPVGSLPRVEHTAREAQTIAALTRPGLRSISLGFEANKQRFLATDLSAYSILHVATHALIDERFPELSGLVLSRVDTEGESIDSELRVHEIYRLTHGADLTVLSGCQTALGQRVRGDGLLGFTQAFLYSGSSEVLVSLWKIDDKATSVLFSEFYRRLISDGESPAGALRQAQLALRQKAEWEAPYYWAPFVLQGDDQVLPFSSDIQEAGGDRH